MTKCTQRLLIISLIICWTNNLCIFALKYSKKKLARHDIWVVHSWCQFHQHITGNFFNNAKKFQSRKLEKSCLICFHTKNASVKCKLMKLTLAVNFINVKQANFLYECWFWQLFSSYMYISKMTFVQKICRINVDEIDTWYFALLICAFLQACKRWFFASQIPCLGFFLSLCRVFFFNQRCRTTTRTLHK